jgi:hypothetical protein
VWITYAVPSRALRFYVECNAFCPAGADSEAVFTNTDLTTTASALFLALTCIGNTVNVWRHVVSHSSTPQLDLFKALGRTTPIIVMHAAAFLWFSHGAFKTTIDAHPHIFYMTLGALFADFTSKLMVSHVADQPYNVDYTGLAIFAFGPVLATLAQYQYGPLTAVPSDMLAAQYYNDTVLAGSSRTPLRSCLTRRTFGCSFLLSSLRHN